MRHILSHQHDTFGLEATQRGAMMNRRQFLYSLTSPAAAGLTQSCLFSLNPNRRAAAERGGAEPTSIIARYSSHERLRVGLVGVVGAGVYWEYRIARKLDYPFKIIAVETVANNDRHCWRHPANSSLVLIGGQDEVPATMMDAYRMGRDRKSDVASLVSDLDVAFLVTGLNGASGKGVTSVVAETLRESDVLSIAIVPGHREGDAVNSLRRLVDAAFEIPYPWQVASGAQDSLWREHFAAAIARKCREITLSLV